MNTTEFCSLYWNLYLNLEQDLINLADYITFCYDNLPTYSTELLKQLLTIGSEFDIVCKSYCDFLNQSSNTEENIQSKNKDILFYAAVFSQKKPDIFSEIVQLKNAPDFFSAPMQTWKCNPSDYRNPELNCAPEWWWAYTQNKHNRNGTIEKRDEQLQTKALAETEYKSKYAGKRLLQIANLENVINALASLFIVEMYYYKDLAISRKVDITIPQKTSRLFELLDWETHIVPLSDVVSVNSVFKFAKRTSKKDLIIIQNK